MMARRLRRLPNINTTPDPHIELAGYIHCHAGSIICYLRLPHVLNTPGRLTILHKIHNKSYISLYIQIYVGLRHVLESAARLIHQNMRIILFLTKNTHTRHQDSIGNNYHTVITTKIYYYYLLIILDLSKVSMHAHAQSQLISSHMITLLR